MKMYLRKANGTGLHEQDAQLMDITITEEGNGVVFHFFRLHFTLF